MLTLFWSRTPAQQKLPERFEDADIFRPEFRHDAMYLLREIIGDTPGVNGGVLDAASFFLAWEEDGGAILYQSYLRHVDPSGLWDRHAQVYRAVMTELAARWFADAKSTTRSGIADALGQ